MVRRKPHEILSDGNNPGNARWCDHHNRLECTKHHRRSKGECHAAAIRGTDACKHHSGFSRDVAIVRGASKITAWSAVGDTAKAIDHKLAVLGVLQMTWLRLHGYSELLRRQVVGAADPDRELDMDDFISRVPESELTGGLIGFRYGAAGRDGTIYAQNEETRALVQLEAAERDRVVKYAEVAHKMGISDRLTTLAERWGDVVALRVSLMLEELNLSPEQQMRVPELLQRHLGQIEIGSGEGNE